MDLASFGTCGPLRTNIMEEFAVADTAQCDQVYNLRLPPWEGEWNMLCAGSLKGCLKDWFLSGFIHSICRISIVLIPGDC